MFVQSVKFIQEHAGNRSNISVFGQKANADTWKMAKMNMAIRGIDANFGDHPEDTFFNDLHSTQKFDFIMANPPFNLSNWGGRINCGTTRAGHTDFHPQATQTTPG